MNFLKYSIIIIILLIYSCKPYIEIVSIPNTTGYIGEPYHYDEDDTAQAISSLWSGAVRWSVVEAPYNFQIEMDTGYITWLPEKLGEFKITIKAQNNDTEDTQTFNVTINKKLNPPKIISKPNLQGCINGNYHYDNDDKAEVTPEKGITWKKIKGPNEFFIDPTTGFIQWIPLNTGKFSISISASNEDGEDIQTFEVDVIDCSPKIISTPNEIGVEGCLYHYNENDKAEVRQTWEEVEWRLNEGPPNFCIDKKSGIISWIPEKSGNYPITISASNSYGTDYQKFQVNVEPPLIKILPIGDKVLHVGESCQFTLKVETLINDSVNYIVNSLPEGATFDPVSAIFSWIPKCNQVGSYSIKFTAFINSSQSDSCTATDTEEVKIEVLPPIPYYIIESGISVKSTSIAIDKKGISHVAYHDYTNQLVKYAKFEYCKWNIESVANVGPFDQADYTSIALDSNNKPYILYFDLNSATLNLASKKTDKWEIMTVDPQPASDGGGDLVIDNKDQLHVVYFIKVNNSKRIKYAKLEGRIWTQTIIYIDGATDVRFSRFPTLVLDSNNFPHLTFNITKYNKTTLTSEVNTAGSTTANGQVMYAFFDGIFWNLEILNTGTNIIPNSDSIIALLDNKPIIVYTTYDDNIGGTNNKLHKLQYALYDLQSNLWDITTIYSFYAYPFSVPLSFTFDLLKNPYIAFYDLNETLFKLASKIDNSVTWNIELLDFERNTGVANSMAIDFMNKLNIVYFDDNNKLLKYYQDK